ncbi:hypothetical protein F6Y05_35370 [Bacillus megaterium]|nr:hypothetical protein [Priestia megaterium]
MIKIEMLYKGKNIQQFLQEVSAKELINEFKSYLGEIVQVGVKIEGKMLARARYLDERTTELVLEFIELFGQEYPEEMLLLLAEQEYTLLNDISERYNLLEYLTQQMNSIQKLQSVKVYNLLSSALYRNSKRLYGKNVYCSVGNRGKEYYGFVNEMYSENTIENGVLGVNFRLQVDVFEYDVLKLGNELGVSEETLEKLKEENKRTQLLEIPRQRSSMFNHWDEQNFKRALDNYTKELNDIISVKYPDILVKTGYFFETRTDVDTDYYINFEKRVEITDNYEETRLKLINTIKTLNKIESQYFDFDYMHKDLVEGRKEYSEKNKPLFEE